MSMFACLSVCIAHITWQRFGSPHITLNLSKSHDLTRDIEGLVGKSFLYPNFLFPPPGGGGPKALKFFLLWLSIFFLFVQNLTPQLILESGRGKFLNFFETRIWTRVSHRTGTTDNHFLHCILQRTKFSRMCFFPILPHFADMASQSWPFFGEIFAKIFVGLAWRLNVCDGCQYRT